MELDHEFTVPVPVDQAWSVLLDVERVALCMPGATLDSVDGEEYAGRLKVKLGAMTITYRGTAKIVEADESARALTIEGSGKEARGSGTASATIRARMSEQDGVTRVAVHTKLNVTGRPAQFGRNILAEVGAKLIARFAKALAEELQEAPEAAERPAAEAPAKAERPAAEAPAEATAPQAAQAEVAEVAEPVNAPLTEAEQAEAASPVGTPAVAGAESTSAAPAEASQEVVDQQAATAAAAESTGTAAAEAPQDLVDQQAAASAAAEGPGVTAAEPPQAVVAEPEPAGAAAPSRPAAEGAARPVGAHRRERREEEAIDILEVAGPSVAKRAVPALGALVALLLTVRYLFRRRRGRHHR